MERRQNLERDAMIHHVRRLENKFLKLLSEGFEKHRHGKEDNANSEEEFIKRLIKTNVVSKATQKKLVRMKGFFQSRLHSSIKHQILALVYGYVSIHVFCLIRIKSGFC
jgi:hypothetical protein